MALTNLQLNKNYKKDKGPFGSQYITYYIKNQMGLYLDKENLYVI